MNEKVAAEDISRDERPSLAKTFDWRAGRTWGVFFGLAAGYGLVAGMIPPLAHAFLLQILRLSDTHTIEIVTVMISVGAAFGWFVLLEVICRSLRVPRTSSDSPSADSILRPWRRTWTGWLLLFLLWLPVGLSTAFGIGLIGLYLVYGSIDLGKLDGLIMALVLGIGSSTLPGFMDRWGQRRARDA